MCVSKVGIRTEPAKDDGLCECVKSSRTLMTCVSHSPANWNGAKTVEKIVNESVVESKE